MRLLSALACVALLNVNPASAIWPRPAELKSGSTILKLSPSFTISFPNDAPNDLKDATHRAEDQVKNDRLERVVVGRGSADAAHIKSARELTKLEVKYLSSNPSSASGKRKSLEDESVAPIHERDESYVLKVPADGSTATLTASSTLGLFRGLTTFSQLWYLYDSSTYTPEAPYEIKDKPAFPYRGFMLDTARNYFPLADIKRTLDAMSWTKLSHFHWHIVDSQSFPLVLSEFPELAEKGAYSKRETYTINDVKEIISYAGKRGIEVILEMDTPGHTAVIGESHPDYIACYHSNDWQHNANEPPPGQVRLANPAVQKFIANVFTAILSPIKGKGSFFSTGGDEINVKCYNDDKPTQDELKKQGITLEGALDKFTKVTHEAVKQAGRTPIVWQEMVLEHNVTLSKDTVVLVWVKSEDVVSVLNKGYSLIHAPSDYFYLDCGHGGWVTSFPGANSWCEPYKTWQKIYSFDPLSGTTAETAKLVLGGQSLLWTEQSSPSNLDPIVWPRAAALAEVFWTGAGRNATEAVHRITDFRYRLVQRGIGAIQLQPEWCALRSAQNLCDLNA